MRGCEQAGGADTVGIPGPEREGIRICRQYRLEPCRSGHPERRERGGGSGDWHSGGSCHRRNGAAGSTGSVGRNRIGGHCLGSGGASIAFGISDTIEALQDINYGAKGSSKKAYNIIRDGAFKGNDGLYYGLEMLATVLASAGTITFRSFNMESEIKASTMAGAGKTISYTDYDNIYKSSIHNAGKDKVMLGKYDGGGATSYITKAGSEYEYFSLGKDWDTIKVKYGYTDNDMFKLFNEAFLDDGINAGKTFQFSHNPINDTGALGQEYQYLLNNNYKWDTGTMTMYP